MNVWLPLSLWFNPVYLAAAYLDWTQQNILNTKRNGSSKDGLVADSTLPKHIARYPWYCFVDPNIDPE